MEFVYGYWVNLAPIIATSIGIMLYRGVLVPALGKYRAWRDGPRIRTARRNWRGVYVPDLTIKRIERFGILLVLALFVCGAAVGWTIMVPGR